MNEVLSVRQYALRRNPPVSHTAVRNAIQSGRLAASVKRRPNGRVCGIEVAVADREWLANTDPGAQRDVEVRAGAPRGERPQRAEAHHPPDSTPGLFPGVELPPEHPAPAAVVNGAPVATANGRLPDLRARLMDSQVSLAALELAEKTGQLVDVRAFEDEIASAWGLVSTGFLSLAESLPAELAAMKGDVARIRARLRAAVRFELERLADMIGGG